MRRFIPICLTAAAMTVLMATAPAVLAAPPVDAQGAEVLKKVVNEAIAGYVRNAAKDGNTLSTGTVTVTPKGSYYEVRVPDVSSAGGNGKMIVGTVVMNAAPTDSGAYMTSIALPTRMSMTGADNAPQYSITLGQQKFSGAFLPAARAFTKVDAEYKDIALKSLGGKTLSIRLDKLKNTLNMSANADKSYSGFNDTVITGIAIHDKSQDGQRLIDIGAGSFATKIFYDKFDMLRAKAYADRIADMYGDAREIKTADLQKATQDIMDNVADMIDGFSNKTEIRDLALDIRPAPGAPARQNADGTTAKPEEPISLKIAAIDSGLNARGVRQEKGSLSFTASATKVSFAPMTDDIGGLVPQNVNIDISATDIPMKNIVSLLGRFMDRAAQATMVDRNDQMKMTERAARKKQLEIEMKETLAVLPSLLVRSGATLNARNTYIETPDVLTTLEGTVKAAAAPAGQPQKPLPLAGTVTLSIRGIDEAVQKMQKETAKPGADPRLATLQQGLMMVQLLGQPNKAPNGQSLRVYKVEFTADGKTLMNGVDIGGISLPTP